jgi:hypothetical protein
MYTRHHELLKVAAARIMIKEASARSAGFMPNNGLSSILASSVFAPGAVGAANTAALAGTPAIAPTSAGNWGKGLGIGAAVTLGLPLLQRFMAGQQQPVQQSTTSFSDLMQLMTAYKSVQNQ